MYKRSVRGWKTVESSGRRSSRTPVIESLEQRAVPAVFVVTTALDVVNPNDGVVSLREAITFANNSAGLDTISFNIPQGGVHTIVPASPLPAITDSVVIDGYTQPGASVNTLEQGSNAVLMIEISGPGGGGTGLQVNANDSVIRGLVINRFINAPAIDVNGNGNRVEGNFLGTDASGTSNFIDESREGVSINGTDNIVGGLTPDTRNVISGHRLGGINIFGTGAGNNVVQGNLIGVDKTGLVALGNGQAGITITGFTNNLVGGTTAAARNIISGNAGGIVIFSGSNTVQGNFIGTDITGTVDLGNSGNGIFMQGAANNLIGGLTNVPGQAPGNLISGNDASGIDVNGNNAPGHIIQGNLIGVDITGTKVIGNLEGISIRNSGGGNLIGDTDVRGRNVISGSANHGVSLNNSDNRLLNNYIGVGLDGTTGLGNGRSGVLINSQSGNTLTGNVIAFSGEDGITVNYFRSGTGNVFLSNSIFGNTGLGIDLGNDDVTPNDLGDADTGANDLQNFPVLDNVFAGAGGTGVQGHLNSTPNTTFRLQFFLADGATWLGAGQGKTLIGTTDVTTDAAGNAVFTSLLSTALGGGQYITATATNLGAGGGTSEFSTTLPTSALGSHDLVLNISDNISTATPGSLLTYTLSFSNDGDRNASGVRIVETLPLGTTFNPTGSTAGWTETSPGVFTLVVGDLAAHSGVHTATFAVLVTNPVASGLEQITAQGSIADDGAAGSDANPANNSSTDTNTLLAGPDLHVAITKTDSVVRRGGKVEYTVSYTNQGMQDATGVFLTHTVPAGSKLDPSASTPGWYETVPGSGVYRFDIGNLPANTATASIALGIKVLPNLPSGVGNLTPVVSIADDLKSGADLNPLDNSASTTTSIYQGVYIVSPGVPARKGAPPTVRVFDIGTGTESFSFDAYESTYRDSIRVAVGDLNGDGIDDIITSTRTGSGRVRVFDGLNGTQFSGTFAQIDAFTGKGATGAFVASGDVTGDGRDDIIVGSGRGGGSIKIFDGTTGAEIANYVPFSKSFRGGVRVATGDVNGDGVDDVIVGQGDLGSRVKVFSGSSETVLHSFNAAPSSYRFGIFVSAADLDGDAKADIITARDINSPPVIVSFSGVDLHPINRFVAFNPSYRGGVRVAATDLNFDGIAEIIATSGTKGGSKVKIFDGRTTSELPGFVAFPDFSDVALFVAASANVRPVEELPPTPV